jgi:hypothetical protein
VVRLGRHADGAMKFQLDGAELAIEFEAAAVDPKNSWIRLKYAIADHWTGPQHAIEDEFRLTTSRRHSAGCDGGSCAQTQTGACASSFCHPAGTGFDHDTRIS